MDLENFCNCRSDLENLGEQQFVIRALLAEGIRELSNAGGIRGGGVTSLLSPRKTGGVVRGARHATPTSRQSGARHVKSDQGLDTSKSATYRYRGSTRHVVVT